MKLLPIEHYDIVSLESTDAVFKSIDKNVQALRLSLLVPKGSKPLIGKRMDKRFNLRRVIRHQNPFLPIAFGEIKSDDGRVRVSVTLRMNRFVSMFLTLWASMCLLATVQFLFSDNPLVVLVPLVMLAFLFLIARVGFWNEVPKIKRLLSQVLLEAPG